MLKKELEENYMKGDAPQTKYLKDYEKPTHLVEKIDLTFNLHETQTLVESRMEISPLSGTSLTLNGEELKFISAKVNGELVNENSLKFEENLLTISNLPNEKFVLEISNHINPKENTALDGLYMSGGIFCSQNEPEGFRRITYFIDRPDNLSIYTTKIVADKKLYPVLLSNGNLIDSGDLEEGKHFALWADPFPKPSYLYALVAGDLGLVQDSYKTASGRDVDLRIYVDKGNESKCDHAMESLKNSMKWDEERFGLEYDLDIYMIVAVDSFNMGAMENKGLNIFNSAYVLADKETATDANFFGIESVIGHEYFHNWTGNRITCRDWFQLTLKEGLTVFRDQEFSADLNSRAVCRINDVKRLRSFQFAEDGGPTAHPIKPKSYIEMNNFYTATVYEKGAEIIRMFHTLLGEDGFRRGMDKYFELFDGQAVTTEDFLHAMSVANNDYDFSKFSVWYDQAGTPVLDINYDLDQEQGRLKVVVKQSCPSTPGQETKLPFHMPFKIGLVKADGSDFDLKLANRNDQMDLGRGVLHLKNDVEEFVFEGITEKVVPSLNRGFSAPVRIKSNLSIEDLAFLMANDSDEFNRYESSHVFAKTVLAKIISSGEKSVDESYINSWGKVIADEKIDDEFKSLCMSLPTVGDIVQDQEIHLYQESKEAINYVKSVLVEKYEDSIVKIYNSLTEEGEFKVDAKSMGRRTLKNKALSFLGSTTKGKILAKSQYDQATNMTDRLGAMTVMINSNHPDKDAVLADFYNKFKSETLVMQKWLLAQANSEDDSTFDRVKELLESDVYDQNVPNLVRSLIGTFARNEVQFNHPTGRGIKFVAEQIKLIDKINPQVASRLASAFRDLKRMPKDLQELAKAELKEIVEIDGLSKNVYEIVSKTLA